MKNDADLTPEKQKEYDYYESELLKLAEDMDKEDFKDSIEKQNLLFSKYLELSDKQNKIKKHSSKRRMKDKLIRSLLDYSNIMLELKVKSVSAYRRAQESFKGLFKDRMSKYKAIKKK